MPGLGLLKNLVIDPRNDIEHAYNMATEAQARQAYEVADLFLRATEIEAGTPAIIALGWNVNYRGSMCSTPGKEYERIEYSMASFHPPMLLIDAFEVNPEVFVLYSKDELLSVCLLNEFSSAQIIELNGMLRQYLKYPNTQLLERKHMKLLRDQLKL